MRFITILITLQGCMTPQPLDPQKNYMKTMEIEVNNGKKHRGVAVIPASNSYYLDLSFYEDSEVIKITTVHREHVYQDKSVDDYKYKFTPAEGLENQGPSGIELGAFDSEGQHTWGYIEIHTGEKLTATLWCNGMKTSPQGVSICQSKVGLLQRISFETEVKAYSTDRCETPKSEDGKIWIWTTQTGKCLYVFSPINAKGSSMEDTHRMTAIGYDEVLIRN